MNRWAAVPRSVIATAPTSAALAVWIAEAAYPHRSLTTREVCELTGLGERAVRASRSIARSISLDEPPGPGFGLRPATVPVAELSAARAAGPAALRLWALAHLARDGASGVVRWSKETAASLLGVCVRTIGRALDALSSRGLVTSAGRWLCAVVARHRMTADPDQFVTSPKPLPETPEIEGAAAAAEAPSGQIPPPSEVAAAAAELQRHAGPLSAVGLARLARRAATGGAAALWRAVEVAADLADRAAFGGAFLPPADVIVTSTADRWRVLPRRRASATLEPPASPQPTQPAPPPPPRRPDEYPSAAALGRWVEAAAASHPSVAEAVAAVDAELSSLPEARRLEPSVLEAAGRLLASHIADGLPEAERARADAAAAVAESGPGAPHVRAIRCAQAVAAVAAAVVDGASTQGGAPA